MKKVFTLALLLLLATSLWASIFQIGPSATANYELSTDDFDADEEWDHIKDVLGDVDNYTYGVDARINISKIQLSGTAEVKVDGDYTKFNSTLAANYVFFHNSLLNCSVGMGPKCIFATKDWKSWHVYDTNNAEVEDFTDVILKSRMNYRLGVNFSLLGLGVSAAYYLPADASFNHPDKSWVPNLEEGSICISLLFGLL